MLEILVNAAARLLFAGAVLWLALRLLRVRNPHAEALTWRMLLLAGMALPVLLGTGLSPSVATTLHLPELLGGGAAASTGSAPVAATGWSALPAIALTIYLAVALPLLTRFCIGLLALWRMAQGARRIAAPGDVRISFRLRSPATFGSIILLPVESQQWPADKCAAVMAHERAHVRSRDVYWSWLAQLQAAIFWFNPFAWWLRRRLEILAETTSDDAVVAARHDPVAYAALLLEFARQPNSRSVAMSVAESNVPRRIERLLARVPPGAELSRAARWTALAALVPVVFLGASTTRAIAGASGDAAQTADTSADSVRIARAPDPDRFYPEAAKQAKATGLVTLEVRVDAQGRLLDVKVLEPLPAQDPYGFGVAAVEVARGAEYANPLGRTSSLKFKVKFALTSDPPAPAA